MLGDMSAGEITLILQRMESGDRQAAERLLALVYDELRRIAAGHMAHERPGHTLQPTALVHEAWLRLGADQQPNWKNRAHFFGAAAQAMRQILVDSARRRLATKRGGRLARLNIDDIDLADPTSDARVVCIHEALEKFAAVEPRKAELVKLCFFGGRTRKEAARLLEISESTADRWWGYARAWLIAETRNPRP